MIYRNAFAINNFFKKENNLFCSFIVLVAITGCNYKKSASADFAFYKKKYAMAVIHYSQPKDSLKLKALYFLLNNLSDQHFFDSDGIRELNKSILKSGPHPVNDLIKMQDSISQIYPATLSDIKDENVITDSYLIENIDRAFESRKHVWTKALSFDDFCEYVLPYKVGNEKPEEWGVCLKSENYLRTDSILTLKNMFDVAAYVNNHLSWYKGTTNYDYPIDAGYKMTRFIGTGTCYSMSRMIVFQARALGLPVTIDFAPTWGNRSDGHSWNALIYKNRPYPFDAAGPNIGFYKIEFKGIDRVPYKISKVFRQTFSIQENSLAALRDSSETIPSMFDSKRIKDVTNQYVPVSDITLSFSKKFPDKFAYLCTFNNSNWIPSFWGRIENSKIIFNNMGRDMVYLPVLYHANNGDFETVPIGDPFILFANGRTEQITANPKLVQTLIIIKKYPEDETNKIEKGDLYQLFYWQGGWKSSGVQKAKSNQLYYNRVPSKALYWIRDLTKGKQERIFTYENGKQVWW